MTAKSSMLIGIIMVVIGLSWLVSILHRINTPKFDYYLQLDKDQVYLIDKKGDTIHQETMDWKLEETGKLQQSIIKDNL